MISDRPPTHKSSEWRKQMLYAATGNERPVTGSETNKQMLYGPPKSHSGSVSAGRCGGVGPGENPIAAGQRVALGRPVTQNALSRNAGLADMRAEMEGARLPTMPFRKGFDAMKPFLPRATEPEAERSFATYRNYLGHLRSFLEATYPGGALDVVVAVRALPKCAAIQRRQFPDQERREVERSLHIAWVRELQLAIPRRFDDEILPHLVQGSATHSYYSVFHGVRALLWASGQTPPDNHSGTLKAIGSWVSGRSVFPAPWSSCCSGGPDATDLTYAGDPASQAASLLSPLATVTSGSSPASLQMLLRTTRLRQIDDLKEEWRRREKKKKVPRQRSLHIAGNLPATTLFDAAWRLRKRSDYEDADAFVDGIPTQADASTFSEALIRFTSSSLDALAALTVAYVGREVWSTMSSRFVDGLPSGSASELEARTNALV